MCKHNKQNWFNICTFPLQSIEENEVYLPSDELWIYDMDSGLWQVAPFTFSYYLRLIFVTDLQGKAFRDVGYVKLQVFKH